MRSENKSVNQENGPPRSFIEDARRRQIVDAAIYAIAEFGYAGVSFAKIATRAEISPSLISYHFSGKAELVETVAATINSGLDAALSAEMAAATGYLAAARALATGFVRYADRNRPQMLALWQLSTGLVDAEHASQPAVDAERSIAELGEFVREGQEAGEFRDGDVRMLAALMKGMLDAATKELFARNEVDIECLELEVAAVVERLLRVDNS